MEEWGQVLIESNDAEERKVLAIPAFTRGLFPWSWGQLPAFSARDGEGNNQTGNVDCVKGGDEARDPEKSRSSARSGLTIRDYPWVADVFPKRRTDNNHI